MQSLYPPFNFPNFYLLVIYNYIIIIMYLCIYKLYIHNYTNYYSTYIHTCTYIHTYYVCNVLLGLDPPDQRCSTPLMQRPIEVVVIHVDDQLHWQKKTPKQIRETVAEIIRSRMSVHQTEAKSSASPDTPAVPRPAASPHHRQPDSQVNI